MRWIGLLFVALVGCAGCGSSNSTATIAPPTSIPTPSASATTVPTPASLTVTPILALRAGSPSFPNFKASGKTCKGIGRYADLRPGRAITIFNQKGNTVVGTGSISKTVVDGTRCLMTGDVRGLPLLPFYEVQFANRTKLAFSHAELVHHKSFVIVG